MNKLEKLEKLTNDHEKSVICEEKEFQLKLAVINKLPEDIEPKYIHTYISNDKDCSLCFEDVSKKRLLELNKIFPELPMVLAKGTFTTFLPESVVDKNPDKYKNDIVTLLFPYKIKTNSCTSYTVKISWHTMLEIKGLPLLTEIECTVNFPNEIAHIYTQTRSDRYEGLVIDKTDISICKDFVTIQDKEPMGFQHLKWGRGSNKYAHDFSLYSTAYDRKLSDIKLFN